MFAYFHISYDLANECVQMIKKAMGGLGMDLEIEPVWVEVPDDFDMRNDGFTAAQLKDGGSFSESILSTLQEPDCQDVRLVFVLLENEKHHARIKKALERKGIASQMLLKNNIRRRMQLGVWSNILKQINSKCGLDLYRISYSPKIDQLKPMVVGLDVINMGGNCIVGLVASFNKDMTQYYSMPVIQNLHRRELRNKSKEEQQSIICRERAQILENFLIQAIQEYQNLNQGMRPEMIAIYRDGVGGNISEQFVNEFEGPNGFLMNAIQSIAQGYNPKILYTIVDKKSGLRLFKGQAGQESNPSPGTVVDSVIVSRDNPLAFDFIMISNENPRFASALPVVYKVLTNTTGLSKGEIETFTYHQCYNYFGFSGPIKVPAALKYAEKLAQYSFNTKVSTSIA